MVLPAQFSNLNYTPDVIIIIILGAVILYGLLLGRNKVKTLALSVYVGIVVSSELGATLYKFLTEKRLDLNGRLSQNALMIGLFVLPMLILELGRREHHGRGSRHGGAAMTMVLAVLTASLVIASGLKLLDPDTQKRIMSDSTLATGLYALRLWWVATVPLAVIGENFIRNKEH